MDSLVTGFNKEYETQCEVIPGSSGKLFAQIREGAPYDIFLSADPIYTESLHREGLTADEPGIFAYGALVLWSVNPNINPSLGILETYSIRHIALANPKIAPFGRAAMEVLHHHGLEQKIMSKLVYGESVAQANQFIESGSADIGFTSLAIVMSPEFEKTGKWVLVDPSAYNPLPHGAVLIKNDKLMKTGAREFYQYLFTTEGQAILKNFGYSVHE
jgi:molybdate transport system substrate-binding protein